MSRKILLIYNISNEFLVDESQYQPATYIWEKAPISVFVILIIKSTDDAQCSYRHVRTVVSHVFWNL